MPALADLDCDNDLDLILGDADGTLQFYENTGNVRAPIFTAAASASVDRIDVGDRAAPALADLDHDGDMDLIVGAADGSLNYFRNDGNAYSPNFVALTGTDNPFDGLSVPSNAIPTAGDVDYDNLIDVLVGAADGTVEYLSNTGTVVAPAFTVLTELIRFWMEWISETMRLHHWATSRAIRTWTSSLEMLRGHSLPT